MKTRYRHIHFVKNDEPLLAGPAGWVCRNNRTDDKLGDVFFYDHWRKFCFDPGAGGVFDAGCLRDIIHFLEQLSG